MSKRFLSVAVAAALALPLSVQAADVDVFGVAHVSLNQFDVGATDGELNLTSNKSYFGLKGSEDLGNGLSAIFKLMWQVDYTDNSTTPPDKEMLVYDRFVGLKGGFGTIKAGTMASNYNSYRFAMIDLRVISTRKDGSEYNCF